MSAAWWPPREGCTRETIPHKRLKWLSLFKQDLHKHMQPAHLKLSPHAATCSSHSYALTCTCTNTTRESSGNQSICVHTTKWQSTLHRRNPIWGHLNLSFAWRCGMHARQLIPSSFTLPCYNSSPLELSSKWNIGYHYRSSWRKQYPLCLLGA